MKKIFIIVGWLNIPKEVVYEIFNKKYTYCKCLFVEKDHYLQSKFTYANATGKKIDAIFIGPIPHKTFAAGNNKSMVAELCIANSITPVYVCRNKAGVLKFTKTSLRQAVNNHELHLQEIKQEKKNREDKEIMEFKMLIKTLFPNQKLF